VCKGHAKCPYQIFVGKRPDSMFAVKRIVSRHHAGHPTIPSVASMPRKYASRNESEDDEEDTSDEDSTSDKENGIDEDNNNDDDAGTMDNLFEELLSKRSMHAYPCLEDFDPSVEAYERKSGNHLVAPVTRSERSIVYRHYVCKEHVNCSFEFVIGRRPQRRQHICSEASCRKTSRGAARDPCT
jgi:hypothetical protein